MAFFLSLTIETLINRYTEGISLSLRFSIAFLFLFLSSAPGYSQLDNSSLLFNNDIDTTKEEQFFIKFQNLDFMKNNEYSGPMADGYTLFGYQLNPQLGYQISRNLTLEGGIYLSKDFGNKNFTEISPTYSLRYRKKDFKMIFGNIDGSLNHQLVEPIYNFERILTNRLENGMQFMVNKKRYDFDIWVDWLHMIYKQSNTKEKFQVGICTNFLKVDNTNWMFRVPLQVTLVHTGGQIDTLNKIGSSTDVNSSGGIVLTRKTNSRLFQKIYMDVRYLRKDYAYFYNSTVVSRHGDGLLANLGFKSDYGTDLMFTYWYGNYYYNDYGGFLYTSVSQTVPYPGYVESIRDLIIMRFTKKINLAKNINLTLRAEPYFDIRLNYFEYSYGFYITVDEKAWLRKKPLIPRAD